MMQIIFTRSKSILSKAIMGCTDEPVSHTALLFRFGELDVVVHSNLLGVHLQTLKSFKEHSEIIYALDSQDERLNSVSNLEDSLAKYEFSMYDFGALLFSGMSLLLRSKLGIPLPKSNLWQSTGMFMCTEWVTEFVDNKEDSMITPFQLYLRLRDSGSWVLKDDKF